MCVAWSIGQPVRGDVPLVAPSAQINLDHFDGEMVMDLQRLGSVHKVKAVTDIMLQGSAGINQANVSRRCIRVIAAIDSSRVSLRGSVAVTSHPSAKT